MQVFHIFADRVVQTQLAGFAQLHDAAGGESLGMRSYAEAVPQREWFAGRQIGRAVRSFEGDLVAMHDDRDAPRQPRQPHLKLEPGCDVVAGSR